VLWRELGKCLFETTGLDRLGDYADTTRDVVRGLCLNLLAEAEYIDVHNKTSLVLDVSLLHSLASVEAAYTTLKAGHSEGLTAYLTAMGRFHSYSFGNILEIARQRAVT
jgi:hypothetical protein